MRLKKLKKILQKDEKTPYLVTDLVNIKYITGFTGSSAYMIIGDKKSWFITDSRYQEYAESIIPKNTEFVLQDRSLNEIIRDILKKEGIKELYAEESSLTFSFFTDLKKTLRGVKLMPGGSVINELRMCKDDSEIEILKKAAEITDRCVDHLKKIIKPGMYEWDIAVEIEYFYRKNGCRKSSFEAIVASGTGSSMPHYEPSMEKKVMKGEIILIDMGCEYMGYNSDLTRTMFVNSIDPELEKIYHIVQNAQETAVSSVKPGITTGNLDSIARNIIEEQGYGEMFGHSLGHGYGLEIHEMPSVKKDGELRLRKNMTITVEPGIYIPGKGGVRIEDMVLVTSKGHEVLTRSSKDIIVI